MLINEKPIKSKIKELDNKLSQLFNKNIAPGKILIWGEACPVKLFNGCSILTVLR